MYVFDTEMICRDIQMLMAQHSEEDIDYGNDTRDSHVTVRLTPLEHHQLKRQAQQLGVSVSEYIRTGIHAVNLLSLLMMKGGVQDEEISQTDWSKD